HSEEEGLSFTLRSGALIGTASDVTEQIAELHEAGAGHILCQMRFGFLGHERIKASMRRFCERVISGFRPAGSRSIERPSHNAFFATVLAAKVFPTRAFRTTAMGTWAVLIRASSARAADPNRRPTGASRYRGPLMGHPSGLQKR